MSKFIMLLVLSLILVQMPAFAENRETDSIDWSLKKEVDVTNDGKVDVVSLHITGKNIKAPFTWSIEITSKGKPIYSKKVTDNNTNDLFGDDEYIGGCRGYNACKMKWYKNDLLDLFISKLSPDFVETLESNHSINNTKKIEKMLVQNCHLSKDKAVVLTNNIKETIKMNKAYGINRDPSPITSGPIAIWVPVLNRFVDVWDD